MSKDWYNQRYEPVQKHQNYQKNHEYWDQKKVALHQAKQQRIVESQECFTQQSISYEVKGNAWLCKVDSEEIYYQPTTGKWRPKGKKIWYNSSTALDFLHRVKRFHNS